MGEIFSLSCIYAVWEEPQKTEIYCMRTWSLWFVCLFQHTPVSTSLGWSCPCRFPLWASSQSEPVNTWLLQVQSVFFTQCSLQASVVLEPVNTWLLYLQSFCFSVSLLVFNFMSVFLSLSLFSSLSSSLFVSVCICYSVCPCAGVPVLVCLSSFLSVCASPCLSSDVSVCCLSSCLSLCISLPDSRHLFPCLSSCLWVCCLSVFLSQSLSPCLFCCLSLVSVCVCSMFELPCCQNQWTHNCCIEKGERENKKNLCRLSDRAFCTSCSCAGFCFRCIRSALRLCIPALHANLPLQGRVPLLLHLCRCHCCWCRLSRCGGLDMGRWVNLSVGCCCGQVCGEKPKFEADKEAANVSTKACLVRS